MKTELLIELHCTDFPGARFEALENIFVGVQNREDIESETPGNSVRATFQIPVTCSTGKDGRPNFTGPYVFGTSGDKFLYLVWYAKVGSIIHRFRRAKIKLNALDWEQIDLSMQQQKPVRAHIKMTDKKGGPVCASLKAESIRWE